MNIKIDILIYSTHMYGAPRTSTVARCVQNRSFGIGPIWVSVESCSASCELPDWEQIAQLSQALVSSETGVGNRQPLGQIQPALCLC